MTLILSLIILVAIPFQVVSGMQTSNSNHFGSRTDWLIRAAALAAIVSILAFGSAMQNYGGDASASTKPFPNATFALSIWAAIVFAVMTLLSFVAGLFDFKDARGALSGRVIKMAIILVFALTTAALFYWNFIPDPLFL